MDRIDDGDDRSRAIAQHRQTGLAREAVQTSVQKQNRIHLLEPLRHLSWHLNSSHQRFRPEGAIEHGMKAFTKHGRGAPGFPDQAAVMVATDQPRAAVPHRDRQQD